MADLSLEKIAAELFGANRDADVKLSALVKKIPRPRVYNPVNGDCFDYGDEIKIALATNRCDAVHRVRLINASDGSLAAGPTDIPITCDSAGSQDGTGLLERFGLPTSPAGDYIIEIEVEGSYTSGPSIKIPCPGSFWSRVLKWLGIK